jgi:photosystem II stability/assembly factor-like uncharacterized protein
MGRSLFSVIFCILAAAAAFAQDRSARGQAGTPAQLTANGDAALRAVAFADFQRGFAVGDRGTLWGTTDGGGHWHGTTLKVDADLTDIYFLNEQLGWISGRENQPLLHSSRGVLFHTKNGGRTWAELSTQVLPGIQSVRFFSPNQGAVAGQHSSFIPAGLATTKDGLGWSVLASGSGADVVTAHFLKLDQAIIGGERGMVAKVTAGEIIPSTTPGIGSRTIRDIEMIDQRYGWLVGDGGLILRTDDGGLNWYALANLPQLGLVDGVDWRSVATHGNSVWIAGAPGSILLHSPDAGNSWEMQFTGQTFPLNSIHFRTANEGVAAGALGTLITTSDAGLTWKLARREAERVAVLVFSAETSDIEWDVLARYAAADGRVTVVDKVFRRDVELGPTGSTPRANHLQKATSVAGGSNFHQAWQFPLRQPGIDPPSAEVYDAWRRLYGGNPRERMLDYLVRQIRTWRPTIVVAPMSNVGGSQAMLVSSLEEAVLAAASSDQQKLQIDKSDLAPWQVTRLLIADSTLASTSNGFTTSRYSTRIQNCVGTIAAEARTYVEDRYRASEPRIGFRTLVDHEPVSTRKQDLFTGLGKTAQATTKQQFPAHDDDGQNRANAVRLLAVQQAIASQRDGRTPLNVAQLGQFGDDLPKNLRDVVHLELEQLLRTNGHYELADEHLKGILMLGRSPYAEWAAERRILLLASGEQGWAIDEATTVQTGETVRPASFITSGTEEFQAPSNGAGFGVEMATHHASKESVLSTRRLDAITEGEMFIGLRAHRFADPHLGLILSASNRLEGQNEQAAKIYRKITTHSVDMPWAAAASHELWLQQRQSAPPQTQHMTVRQTVKAPLLDGKLDDECWNVEPIQLKSPYRDDESWPASVFIAQDTAFLYIAARCQKTSVDRYPDRIANRGRNAELDSWDRLRICIDVDRDYASYFELTVDCRGAVLDRLIDNAGWNPRWYVADFRDDLEWGFEAAIPWDEIVPPEQRSTILMNIARVAPMRGVQSWSPHASVQPDPQGFGIVTLNPIGP